jgi:hypothetical protein
MGRVAGRLGNELVAREFLPTFLRSRSPVEHSAHTPTLSIPHTG